MADSPAHNVMSPTMSLVSLSLCRDINKKTLCHVIYTWLSSLCALQAMHLKHFIPVYSCVYFLAASSSDATWLPGSAHHGTMTIANWFPPTASKSQILASHHLVVVFL